MEYWLEELGYFSEVVCKALQEEFNGATYFDIKIKYSNYAGNCTLGVDSNATNKKQAKKAAMMFLAVALNRIYEKRRVIKGIGKVK